MAPATRAVTDAVAGGQGSAPFTAYPSIVCAGFSHLHQVQNQFVPGVGEQWELQTRAASAAGACCTPALPLRACAARTEEAVCQATTAFMHVMRLLVPVACAAIIWPPHAATEDATAAQHRQSFSSRVQRAVDAADDTLRWLLGVQTTSLAERAAVLAYWAGAGLAAVQRNHAWQMGVGV